MSISTAIPLTPGTIPPQKTVTPDNVITPTETPIPVKEDEYLDEKGNPTKGNEDDENDLKSEDGPKALPKN